MNLKKLFVGVAAMSLVLVGCNKTDSPWSNADRALFNQYIHGEALPYFSGVGKLTVEYDDYEEVIRITSANTTNNEALVSYATKYSEAKGWRALETDLYQYAFEKMVKTKEGERYVAVSFALVDDEGYVVVDDGTLSLLAYDPYVYEFPTDYLDEAIEYYFGVTEISVPVVDSPRYYVNDVDVQCYDVDQDEVAAFETALGENGFNVFPSTLVDDYGYRIAVSVDSVYSVTFKYFEEDAVLDIYLDGPFQTQWTDVDTQLHSLFTKYAEYGATYFLVPSFTSNLYRVVDDPSNELWIYYDCPEYLDAIVTVFNVDENAITTYSSQLAGSGWELDSEEDYIYATKTDGDLTRELEVEFDGESTLTITVYLVGLSQEEAGD